LGYFIIRRLATKGERRHLCNIEVPQGSKTSWTGIAFADDKHEALLAGAKAAGLRVPPNETRREKAEFKAWRNSLRNSFDRQRTYEADITNAFHDGYICPSDKGPPLNGSSAWACLHYVAHMRSQNKVDFIDQVSLGALLVRSSERIRANLRQRYAHILVDEFQDVGATELALLQEIGRSFSIVGDDDQGIFSFKSGLPCEWQALHRVRDEWANLTILELHENRRCPPAAVNFAYAVVQQNFDRIPKVILPLRTSGEAVVIAGAANYYLEIAYIANCIREIVRDPSHSYRDCVIISRRNSVLNSIRVQFKQLAPDLPVSRSGVPDAKDPNDRFGSQCEALVSLLELFLPGLTKASLIETVTGLCPKVPVAQVVAACSGASEQMMSGRQGIDHLSNWHVKHAASELGQFLRIVEKLDGIFRECATLRQVVTAAKNAASKLGVGCDGDMTSQAFPSQAGVLSAPQPSIGSAISATDGFEKLLLAAGRIDEEADKLRANETRLVEANKAALADSNDDDDFLALLSNDVRKRENQQRKKKGCAGGAGPAGTHRAAPQAASPDNKSKQQKERMERLALFVARARELVELAKIGAAVGPTDDTDVVRIMTVHKAKGKEWKFVFVAGCSSDNFPVEGHVIDQRELGEHMREERRIFFVAATRAKQRVTYTFSRQARTSFAHHSEVYREISPFLKEGWVVRQQYPRAVTLLDVHGLIEDPTVVEWSDPGLPNVAPIAAPDLQTAMEEKVAKKEETKAAPQPSSLGDVKFKVETGAHVKAENEFLLKNEDGVLLPETAATMPKQPCSSDTSVTAVFEHLGTLSRVGEGDPATTCDEVEFYERYPKRAKLERVT
jgi:superfamily I DNA/RNA helicase